VNCDEASPTGLEPVWFVTQVPSNKEATDRKGAENRPTRDPRGALGDDEALREMGGWSRWEAMKHYVSAGRDRRRKIAEQF